MNEPSGSRGRSEAATAAAGAMTAPRQETLDLWTSSSGEGLKCPGMLPPLSSFVSRGARSAKPQEMESVHETFEAAPLMPQMSQNSAAHDANRVEHRLTLAKISRGLSSSLETLKGCGSATNRRGGAEFWQRVAKRPRSHQGD